MLLTTNNAISTYHNLVSVLSIASPLVIVQQSLKEPVCWPLPDCLINIGKQGLARCVTIIATALAFLHR